jgi:hypothetical protein
MAEKRYSVKVYWAKTTTASENLGQPLALKVITTTTARGYLNIKQRSKNISGVLEHSRKAVQHQGTLGEDDNRKLESRPAFGLESHDNHNSKRIPKPETKIEKHIWSIGT